MQNPLVKPILKIIEENENGVSEYQLLQQLEMYSENDTPIFSTLILNVQAHQTDLILFRKHFLIMNALYQLQARLWQEDKVRLSISPLVIAIQTDACATLYSDTTELNISADAKLAAYYLDWNEYDNTQAEDVELLLNGFYHKFNHVGDTYLDDTNEALEILGVRANSSKADIKKAYRKRIHKAHPDKGGDTKTFIKLRRAYEHLVSQTLQ